jgi:AcrR family transcriptional regulator
MAVSREKIVEAAIKVLNRGGISQLSMRTLADELSIKAASLYDHIAGKQELYGLIAEFICSKIKLPGKGSNAKKYLYDLGIQYRREFLKIRDSAEIYVKSIPDTPCRIKIIRNTLDCVSQLGVKDEYCLIVANLLTNYVLSFVVDEVRFKSTPAKIMKEIIAPFGDKFIYADNFDEQFLYGLDIIFKGFEQKFKKK